MLRTQRNLRLHFLIAVGVMIAAVAFDVTRFELIALLLSISFVLIAEMLNSAIEAAVDLATTRSTRSPSWQRTSPPAPS